MPHVWRLVPKLRHESEAKTEDGKLPDPKTLTAWTNNFSDVPEVTLGDLYSYLVGKEEYSEENPRSLKGLGYKLYHDGHVIACEHPLAMLRI